ncbi:tryptophan--tRNA ligase [[Clostridium] aminophilum]|uniref:tryptophan--tRNA ligase n=1 Tax=[Clostridium] aminophilum TaxID=1526 RepID=UPI00332090F7
MEAKDCKKKIILTGDRPTGKLHLGHYVGSLQRRVELQNSGKFDEINILVADDQALTDNWDNPKKIRDNIIEVALDYLSIGIDPDKSNICIQSGIPALHALTFYYMNLVTTQRLSRNPTVKTEMKLRGFNGGDDADNEAGLPAGFFAYPVSQAADITAFKATTVPVGEDQSPMIEQTREIVRRFNATYKKDILVEPEILLPENEVQRRLPGLDGQAKMSKSLGNCIFLCDDKKTVEQKIKSMYTDPQHLNVADPGHVEGNMVFTYLDAFCREDQFAEYLPEYQNLDEMKEHYRKGGLGDMKCKKFLMKVMDELLAPIRESRAKWEANIGDVYDILKAGTDHAVKTTNATLNEVRGAMRIDYFDDRSIVGDWEEWLKSDERMQSPTVRR